MFSSIIAMIKKEFLQLRQDKRLLAISSIAPIIQVIIFSYAANTDVNLVTVGFIQTKPSQEATEFVNQFTYSPFFKVVETSTLPSDADAWLDKRIVQIVMIIPSDFSDKRMLDQTANIQVLVDGSDGNTASIAMGYVLQSIGQFNQQVLQEKLSKFSVKPQISQVKVDARIWYNQELKTMNFMVPGILCLVMLIVTTLTTAISIVKEKESGTLEQLIVTPIRPYEIMLGKMIPYSITATFVFFMVMLINELFLGVPFRGSLFLMLGLIYIYFLTTLGLGLFISTISNTQQQAALTTAFLIIPPFVFFSGFIFPVENMPIVIQYFAELLPLKHFLIIIRGIFLKGIGMETIWKEVFYLIGFSLAILGLAVMRFKKKLD